MTFHQRSSDTISVLVYLYQLLAPSLICLTIMIWVEKKNGEFEIVCWTLCWYHILPHPAWYCPLISLFNNRPLSSPFRLLFHTTQRPSGIFLLPFRSPNPPLARTNFFIYPREQDHHHVCSYPPMNACGAVVAISHQPSPLLSSRLHFLSPIRRTLFCLQLPPSNMMAKMASRNFYTRLITILKECHHIHILKPHHLPSCFSEPFKA